jgi:hypothetical protein
MLRWLLRNRLSLRQIKQPIHCKLSFYYYS